MYPKILFTHICCPLFVFANGEYWNPGRQGDRSPCRAYLSKEACQTAELKVQQKDAHEAVQCTGQEEMAERGDTDAEVLQNDRSELTKLLFGICRAAQVASGIFHPRITNQNGSKFPFMTVFKSWGWHNRNVANIRCNHAQIALFMHYVSGGPFLGCWQRWSVICSRFDGESGPNTNHIGYAAGMETNKISHLLWEGQLHHGQAMNCGVCAGKFADILQHTWKNFTERKRIKNLYPMSRSASCIETISRLSDSSAHRPSTYRVSCSCSTDIINAICKRNIRPPHQDEYDDVGDDPDCRDHDDPAAGELLNDAHT